MILVAGSPADGPVAAVLRALDQAGAAYALCDPAEPLAGGMLHADGGRLAGRLDWADGRSIRLEHVRATYARLLDHQRFPAHARLPETERTRADAAQHILRTFLDLTDTPVVNRTAAMGSNRSKPWQIMLIRRLGFDVPPTLISNDPDRVRAFHARHGRLIFKSASAVRSVVREMTAEDFARLPAVRACPVQFQALVEGLDVRVHVVGDRLFATACHSPVVDYRYAAGEAQLVPHTLPDAIAQRCIALAQQLDLPVAGIDLKQRPDGGWSCFEVNPSPGFSWFEAETGQPIAAAIAQLLLTAAA